MNRREALGAFAASVAGAFGVKVAPPKKQTFEMHVGDWTYIGTGDPAFVYEMMRRNALDRAQSIGPDAVSQVYSALPR